MGLDLDSLPVSPLSSSNEMGLEPSPPALALAAAAPSAGAVAPGDADAPPATPPLPRRDPSLVLCAPTKWSLGGSIPPLPLDVLTPPSGDVAAAAAAVDDGALAAAAVSPDWRPVERAMATAAGHLPRGGGFVVFADHVARQPPSPLLAPPPPETAPAQGAAAAGSRLATPSPSGDATGGALPARRRRWPSGAAAAMTLPISTPAPPTSPITLSADGWADLVDAATVEVTHVSDEEMVPAAEAARIRAAMGPMLPSGLALMGVLPRNLSVLPGVQGTVTPPTPASAPVSTSPEGGRPQLPRGVPLRPVNRRRRRRDAPTCNDSGMSGVGGATASTSSSGSPCESAGWATPPSPVGIFDGGSVCTASDGGGSGDAMALPPSREVRTVRTDRPRAAPADDVRLGAGFEAPRPSLATFASRRASMRLLHAGGARGGARPVGRRGLVGRALHRLALLA